MGNHETKVSQEKIHLFLALQRTKDGEQARCIRTVIKDEELDLKILKSKLLLFGGKWRIHKTVNARDPQKARVFLLHRLIDHPEQASYVDSLWRTALLQSSSKAENKWMFDVDSKEREDIELAHRTIIASGGRVIESKMSPGGIHIITEPFDSREVTKLEFVTLQRDGYIFIEKVEPQKEESND